MWLQVSLLARRTKSAAKLQLEIPTRDIKLETFALRTAGVSGETAIHYSRETPVFSRGFQEGGKSDFGMKVKQQRYLKSSLQSTEHLELEPAIDRATLPRCPCLPPRLPPAAAALPFGHPSPAGCARCPTTSGQPPARRGRSQRGPVRQSQWGLAAEARFTQAHAGGRKPKRPREGFFCRSTLALLPAYFWQRYPLRSL